MAKSLWKIQEAKRPELPYYGWFLVKLCVVMTLQHDTAANYLHHLAIAPPPAPLVPEALARVVASQRRQTG